jgi:hypothetical protein
MVLEVYRLLREVLKEFFVLTKDYPTTGKFLLTDRIRRTFRSAGAQMKTGEKKI